jgi:hypothetical protein|tara:strand:- start:400 stop:528 length:129 start_codon:yes stop_codon:yes gene_type:complete
MLEQKEKVCNEKLEEDKRVGHHILQKGGMTNKRWGSIVMHLL